MESIFYSLHDFYLHSKSVTYIFMGIGIFCLLGWWVFLTGRDRINDTTTKTGKH